MPAIRTAIKQDIPRICELYRQLENKPSGIGQQFPVETEYYQAYDRICAMPGHELLVVEDNGLVAGTMVLIIAPNLSHGASPWALVENLVVDSNHRRKGLARLLMEYAIDKAQKAGCYKITLSSHKSRHGAHSFYRSMGFQASAHGFRLYLSEA